MYYREIVIFRSYKIDDYEVQNIIMRFFSNSHKWISSS